MPPVMPVDMMMVPGPEAVLGWLGWLLTSASPELGYAGYMAGAVWLTHWVVRHVEPVAINDSHPAFHPPSWVGPHPVLALGWYRLVLIAIPTAFGAMLPKLLVAAIWHGGQGLGVDALDPLGQLSQWVGGVCGLVIGLRCQFQLMACVTIGLIGYGVLSVMH